MKVHLVAAGKYHDIDFARLELLKLLAERPEIRASVASDYADLASLAAADMLITYTCDLVPDETQTEALEAFLDRGGRWLALHGTNSILRFADDGVIDTPEERPRFTNLLGTRFAGHPPIAPFKVHVTRGDHEMTQGLRDFRVEDELYLTHRTADIDVLLHTAFTGTCDEFRDAAWDEAQVPVLYERNVGQGAILYLTLGHCRGHYDLQPITAFWPHPQRCAWNYPVFYELLRRGIAWARPGRT
ncbi:ThuA domain-containing protein [Novosphingobium malaysiense]|uniref:Trehalose utilization n=1 Tax=Novosphingobium malaysiense TaxID=1348853 RepID=A0A0B1ZVL5_9SPHN|nr:ThuA domain-containing protein [Novosphingobium malaysiense]KHK93182.1 trehalose utilization [Novosphingobium malaysiense]